MAAPSVDILLGTYNGARFLPDQLRSLEQQTWPAWRLIARDDGSADSTVMLLHEFQRAHPDQVELLAHDGTRLGPCGNYGRLLQHSGAPYAMFCDQDDVWAADKVERLVKSADEGDPNQPLLVHSDLEVVDEGLRTVSPSFWRYQRLDPRRCGWPQLLVQNVVTGCAALLNAALRQLVLPIPADAIMHDGWAALVAATCGDIRWIDAPTVRYRQHGRNDTGAKRWGLNQWRHSTEALVAPARYREGLRRAMRQARALAQHPAPIAPEIRHLLVEFSELERRSYFDRLRFVRRHGIAKNGLIRNLVFWRNL